MPLITGVRAAVFVQASVIGAGLGAVFVALPWLQILLKVVGSLYVLWLGWRSLSAFASADQSAGKPIGFFTALGFQFANPKGWLSASATAFLEPGVFESLRIVGIVLIAAVVGAPCNLAWTLFGGGLKRLLSRPRPLVIVNRVLAALLASTVILFWVPA